MEFKSLSTGTLWNNPISATIDTMIRDQLINDIVHGQNGGLGQSEAGVTPSAPPRFERRPERPTNQPVSNTIKSAGAAAVVAAGVGLFITWALSKNKPAATQPPASAASADPTLPG
jgi:hypothetical protein